MLRSRFGIWLVWTFRCALVMIALPALVLAEELPGEARQLRHAPVDSTEHRWLANLDEDSDEETIVLSQEQDGVVGALSESSPGSRSIQFYPALRCADGSLRMAAMQDFDSAWIRLDGSYRIASTYHYDDAQAIMSEPRPPQTHVPIIVFETTPSCSEGEITPRIHFRALSNLFRRSFGPPEPKEGTVFPVLTRKVRPAYPKLRREARKEAVVTLETILSSDGSPGELTCIRCKLTDQAGESSFDMERCAPFIEAAKKSTRRWEFLPARTNGQAIEIFFTIIVDFSLGGKDAPKSKPELIKKIYPKHPPHLRQFGAELRIWLTVREDGTASATRMSGCNILGRKRAWKRYEASCEEFYLAACAAIEKWEYKPKIEDGSPVEGSVEVMLSFSK